MKFVLWEIKKGLQKTKIKGSRKQNSQKKSKDTETECMLDKKQIEAQHKFFVIEPREIGKKTKN